MVTKIVSDVVESMKGQPIVLGLLLINLLYAGGIGWYVTERNKFVEEIIRTCALQQHR